MGHWSSGKYSTDYKDEDNEDVNQSMLSPEREEYPLPTEEPAEDDGEPTDDDEEAPVVAEEEALAEEANNVTEIILPGFAPCRAIRSVGSTLHTPT